MRVFWLAAASIVWLLPAVARAEECSEGDWFCEPSGDAPAEDTPAEPASTPEPAPVTAPKEGPPLVVYTPKGAEKPSRIIVLERPEPKRPPRPRHEWGFDVHLSGALMDGARDKDAGVGGVGFAFRYRPIPTFAVDGGLEILGGKDWEGFERHEVAFLTNALVFFNPRDRLQFFWFGGLGAAGAQVSVEPRDNETFLAHDEHYSYFGAQTGIGLEARVSKKVALQANILGFIRARTDEEADVRPEFVDPDTHQATNVSGGGLLRGGVVFYW